MNSASARGSWSPSAASSARVATSRTARRASPARPKSSRATRSTRRRTCSPWPRKCGDCWRQLGAKDLGEITGRSDLLVKRTDLTKRIAKVDVSKFIRPDMAMPGLATRFAQVTRIPRRLYEPGADAERTDHPRGPRRNRSGPGSVARLQDQERRPLRRRDRRGPDRQALRSRRHAREAGRQTPLRRRGGPELRGVVYQRPRPRPPRRRPGRRGQGDRRWRRHRHARLFTSTCYEGELLSVAGNNVGFGATGGIVFVGGRAGHRLGIRNSGATIVAEAAGKYACEYMTRGRVLDARARRKRNRLGHDRRRIGRSTTRTAKSPPSCTRRASPGWNARTSITNGSTRSRSNTTSARAAGRPRRSSPNWADIRRGRKLLKVLPLAVARSRGDFKTVGTSAG